MTAIFDIETDFDNDFDIDIDIDNDFDIGRRY